MPQDSGATASNADSLRSRPSSSRTLTRCQENWGKPTESFGYARGWRAGGKDVFRGDTAYAVAGRGLARRSVQTCDGILPANENREEFVTSRNALAMHS